jgi:cupin fold WbuC family metalloprotein
MKYRVQNSEVLYSDDQATIADKSDIDWLKEMSENNPRQRIRLCAHDGVNDRLHEMLIVHKRGAYVRPHMHPGKSESTHIVEGLVDLVFFDGSGKVTNVIRMGDYRSGHAFYYRMAAPVFHTLIIRSEVLVFHETTNGPFDREATVFAPWSPEDGNLAEASDYIAGLEKSICLTQSTSKEKS